MSVTIRELAKEAGVSPATVSRYYSGSEVVSEKNAKKIKEVADELNYIHKSRSNHDTGVIAVLLPDLDVAFYAEVLREIIEQIPEYNHRVVFIPTIKGSKDYKKFFKEINIVGVIYLEETIDQDILDYVESRRIKSVLCGGASIEGKTEMVHVNDMAAAYAGTKYLINLGHRKILVLSDHIKSIDSCYQRYAGYKRALDELDININEDELIRFGPVTFDSGYKMTEEALDAGVEFTAIFGFSDEQAVGAISALYDKGIKVPDDISVLGFDNLPIAKKIRPSLTTIHQPISEMVSRTLDSFVNLDNQRANLDIRLPHYIVKRESCMERRL